MAVCKFYEIEQCPHAEECNSKNFANWKPWGNTPSEAQEQVVLHLLGSGLHKAHATEDSGRDRVYYEMIVQTCTVVEKDWVEEPAKKARRHAPPSSSGTVAPTGVLIPMTPPGPPPEHLQPAQARPPSAASASALAASAVALLRSTQTACTVTGMEYKSIIDACGRACKAATNAQRLSAAAAGAFAEEAAIFEDVQQFMIAKLEVQGQRR